MFQENLNTLCHLIPSKMTYIIQDSLLDHLEHIVLTCHRRCLHVRWVWLTARINLIYPFAGSMTPIPSPWGVVCNFRGVHSLISFLKTVCHSFRRFVVCCFFHKNFPKVQRGKRNSDRNREKKNLQPEKREGG